MNAAEPHTRALNRILEHCGPLDDDAEAQPAATLRLRQAIGEELARLLLNALAGDHRRVSLRPIS
ncbi:MAG TPA: hypothetical protein VGJ40_00580 [Gaiellaceae bacterium]|jgi:hypothetical protein